MTESPWWEDFSFPVLLSEGRKTYGASIRKSLTEAGFDDVPRMGARALGGMRRNDSPIRNAGEELGISKQAASQLIDVLVTRGYVDRSEDPDDRRRMIVSLTDRGSSAAAEINDSVDSVDKRLLDEFGAEALMTTRRVLGRLVEIGHEEYKEFRRHEQ